MKITPDTSFAQVEAAQRRAHKNAILRAVAQVNAARELLDLATERGVARLDFWTEALEHAEAEEARARRVFAQWERRDRNADRRAFEFRRALSGRAALHFARLEQANEPAPPCPTPAPRKPRRVAVA